MWRARRPADAEAFSHLIRDRYGAAREAVASWTSFYDLTPVFAHTAAAVYSDSVHFRGPQGYAMLFDELERKGLVDQIVTRYQTWDHSQDSPPPLRARLARPSSSPGQAGVPQPVGEHSWPQ